MTIYKEMEIVRNFVAEVFGESKVSKLKYNKLNQRYHNENYYSFTINNKTPLSITLITGFEPHYKEAIYELTIDQTNGSKSNSRMIKLTKKTATSSDIIDILQNKFKMPIKNK